MHSPIEMAETKQLTEIMTYYISNIMNDVISDDLMLFLSQIQPWKMLMVAKVMTLQ